MIDKQPISSAQFRAMQGKPKKPSKYKNVKHEADGIVFDSLKEYRRYLALNALLKAGKIKDLEHQVTYILVDTMWQTVMGKKGTPLKRQKCVQKSITYVADFRYKMDGQTVVEDVKGVLTEVFRIKRKLLKAMFGIDIKLT